MHLYFPNQKLTKNNSDEYCIEYFHKKYAMLTCENV